MLKRGHVLLCTYADTIVCDKSNTCNLREKEPVQGRLLYAGAVHRLVLFIGWLLFPSSRILSRDRIHTRTYVHSSSAERALFISCPQQLMYFFFFPVVKLPARSIKERVTQTTCFLGLQIIRCLSISPPTKTSTPQASRQLNMSKARRGRCACS